MADKTRVPFGAHGSQRVVYMDMNLPINCVPVVCLSKLTMAVFSVSRSSAMYQALNYLRYKDGTGFPLDT